MQFHTFVFDSDYLETRLISLENCCLLSTRLPMKHPRVFFSRNPSFDCQCEILAIEVSDRDGLAKFRRTQKEARTVLVAIDALSGLDAFIGLGKRCSTVLLDANNTIVEIEGEETDQAFGAMSELPKFAMECGITDVVGPWVGGSSLDSRVLKKTSWLTRTFVSRKVFQSEEEEASLSSFPCFSQGTSSSSLDIVSPQNIEEDDVNNGRCCPGQEGGRSRAIFQQTFRVSPPGDSVNNLIKIMKNPKRLGISSSAPVALCDDRLRFRTSGFMPSSITRPRLTRTGRRMPTGHLKSLYLGEDGYNVESSDCIIQPPAGFCDGWINVANGDHIYRAKASSKRSLYSNIKNAVRYVRREKRNGHHSRPHSHFK